MMNKMNLPFLVLFVIFSFAFNNSSSKQEQQEKAQNIEENPDYSKLDTATFAGGCFWCVEASFEQIQGVKEAVSGFAGGSIKDPEYREVAAGKTDHAETVQVYYDPELIDYLTLLNIFFTAHDSNPAQPAGTGYWEAIQIGNFLPQPKTICPGPCSN